MKESQVLYGKRRGNSKVMGPFAIHEGKCSGDLRSVCIESLVFTP